MKTKINKLVKLAAAGLFLIALAINVKVTLDDPFAMLSEDVIAQTTSGSSSASDDDGDDDVGDDSSSGYFVDFDPCTIDTKDDGNTRECHSCSDDTCTPAPFCFKVG